MKYSELDAFRSGLLVIFDNKIASSTTVHHIVDPSGEQMKVVVRASNDGWELLYTL